MHVATIVRKHGGKTYVSHLLRHSYRDGNRVRHRTLANLSQLPPHTLDYEPDVGRILAAVRSGDGDAGVLLRPVSLDEIANAARRHSPMPEKTSFFYPKPRTGLVFRMLD